ncbi:MAG TPA: SAM-dependent methyltransferase [Oxalobacteraceae bacterium]|nr:SAM-dependent methyltransferase [Oxalobacteraceae bacterium]
MFWENKLDSWVDQVRHQAMLPLRLELWNGKRFDFSHDPQVTIRVPGASSLPYLLSPSLANLGTAYVEGKLDIEGRVDEIIDVGSTLARQALGPAGKIGGMARHIRHTREVDAEAIRYHYDVSNDFYRLWLDENMVYSCAYFENGHETLEEAQLKKIDHILTKIMLKPDQTLLDIGCGWGALVLRAAQKFGARCVGITLSEKQHALASERVRQAGLADRIDIRLQDYRDVTGSFDRITSVGMFEHVGLRQLPDYFSRMRALLADNGFAMNHGITSTDADSGKTGYGASEFIGKYVFPHGELPHISLVLKTMQESGLETLDVENLRRHYAKTCSSWAANFEARTARIHATVDERHFRIWRVYLAGCAYAFANDWVSIFQVLCTKSGRPANALPWSRRYMYS